MCGRFTITRSIREIQERFHVAEEDAREAADLFSPNYNVAPTEPVPVVWSDGSRNRLEMMRWGLVPPWAKDEKAGPPLINARDDSIAVKPAFRDCVPSQRCLVVADGFYEWHTIGKSKHPIRYILREGGLFAFAGLYSKWEQRETDRIIRSCTIITTEPNGLVARIHNRMPVILEAKSEIAWLDPQRTTIEQLREFLTPLAAEWMKEYPVSPAVNSVKNKGAYLIEQFDETP